MTLHKKHIELIALNLGILEGSVRNTIGLLDDGATIPFIARYRKERTGSLDEVQVADIQKYCKKFRELEERRKAILESIEEQGKLTPELKNKILATYDSHELEDLYLPYKKKRKTRADIARELGLEPLAKLIMSQRGHDISDAAARFLNDQVTSESAALQGARDIIAEWIGEDQDTRERLRQTCRKFAAIHSAVVPKKKEEAAKYQDYYDFQEPLHRCPSHRFLAMLRGEQEELLKLNLIIDEERALQMIDKKFIRSNGEAADQIEQAITDSFKRLIFPSVETQVFNEFKEKADEEAIRVFAENLRQLLLAAPLGQKPVLAIDPGYRTGCKVVCLDANGDLVENTTIFPHMPQNQLEQSRQTIRHLASKHQASAIAIGNGTASRETQSFVETIQFDQKTDIYMVNESGASIYSASEVAREEFPDKDVTVRGAVSIGRRLMDPLAELVKIDAKSIGVGQYQHDVHQGKLKDALDQTVVSCVNKVGVNLNTASRHILTYIAGLGPAIAKNIVEFRRSQGDFTAIDQLKKVPRLGEKAFEQAAGFLRIPHGENPLDNTGVHPESYSLVRKMAKDAGLTVADFISQKDIRHKTPLQNYVTEHIGMPTLSDIMKELDKPGLDPRGEAKKFSFDAYIQTIQDVKEGMRVPGIVTNLTNFGAFVDIGVKQDGLLHISQITTKYISSPAEILALGQEVMVTIIGVEVSRKRINLSMIA
ncbi:MAG: RNA-binding transcriptional accessory protein [Saprospiraceae bacterium]|jgi:uncharacterized protein|nr:RNA-binding transcriptional accessory protein [Saprospiraceae bacterium]